jgi:hypothetical protein
MKAPEPIEIEAAEVERLIEQAQQGKLDAAAQKKLIVPLLRTLLETRISLAKLKKILFGKRTEKPRRAPPQPPEGSAGSGGDCGGKSDRPSEAQFPPPEAGDAKEGKQSDPKTDAQTQSGEQPGVGNEGQKSTPRPGHGRLGAADYPGAEQVFCPHDQYQAGDRCPACACGRLYRSRPLVRLRFTCEALANVTHYELEQLRCGACGALCLILWCEVRRSEDPVFRVKFHGSHIAFVHHRVHVEMTECPSAVVQLISRLWRLTAKAFQHVQKARPVGTRGPTRKHLLGLQRGHLFGQGGVDELVQAHAIALRSAACRRQNALRRTQGVVTLAHHAVSSQAGQGGRG